MANSLNIELEGKFIILKSGKGGYKGDTIQRVFFCQDGFGCSSETNGTAIYGEFAFDGDKCRVEGYQVLRLATKEETRKAYDLREGVE